MCSEKRIAFVVGVPELVAELALAESRTGLQAGHRLFVLFVLLCVRFERQPLHGRDLGLGPGPVRVVLVQQLPERRLQPRCADPAKCRRLSLQRLVLGFDPLQRRDLGLERRLPRLKVRVNLHQIALGVPLPRGRLSSGTLGSGSRVHPGGKRQRVVDGPAISVAVTPLQHVPEVRHLGAQSVHLFHLRQQRGVGRHHRRV